MSRERRTITLSEMPVNVPDNIGDYLYAPFRQQGTLATTAEYEGGLYNEDTELTIAGLTTGVWSDNIGWYTPDAAGNYSTWVGQNTDTDDAFWNKLRLDSTFSQKGILVHLDIYYTANPSATEHVIASGETAAVAGGWTIELSSAGTLLFDYKVNGQSDGLTLSLTKNQRNSVLLYLDFENKRVNAVINAGAISQGVVWRNEMLLARDSRVIGLMMGGQSTTPATGALGQHASDARVKNFFIIRPTTDISGNLAQIAAAFNDNENILPSELVSLGVIGG